MTNHTLSKAATHRYLSYCALIGALGLAACGGGGGDTAAVSGGVSAGVNSGNVQIGVPNQSPVTPDLDFIPDNTYYVAANGNNANNGSSTAPWATLQYAASRVQAGDLVLVGNGTYAGFSAVNSGSAQKPIVFKANGTGVIIASASQQDNITINGRNFIVIDGFQVRNAARAGISVLEASGVVIKNNSVGPNARWGIFTGFASGVQILNNKTFNSGTEHGIYVSNSRVANDNPVIRGNESYGNTRSGIQLNGDCYSGGDGVINGAIIENNIVYNNTAKGLSLISIAASVVRNNVLYENGGAGDIHLTDEVSNSVFCGNPTTTTVVVNNTIRESDGTAGIRITDGAAGNTVFNNIVIGSTAIADEVRTNFIDNNIIADTAPTGLFIDAATHNYRLSATSAARNAGVATYNGASAPSVDLDNTARPQGGGIDAGAYERD